MQIMFQAGTYFEMLNADGESRGIFKVSGVHLIGRAVTYRPARWHERLWLWLSRQRPRKKLLNYH